MDVTVLGDWTLFGNGILAWVTALLVTVVAAWAARRGRRMARAWAERRSAEGRTLADDLVTTLVAKVHPILGVVLAVWLGSRFLWLPSSTADAISVVATLTFFWQVAVWGNATIHTAVGRAARDDRADGGKKTTLSALSFLGRLALYVILILLALENLGIDITALLAGIGIASVAIGLALQNILSDLFASLSIVFDKPFEIGDFVIVDDLAGTIENVGLRTTRVRALSGEQLVFANNDLLTSRIRNYKRMLERRVAFGIGVTYDTPAETLREIPEVIHGIIDADENARFDRAHFHAFGDSSLNFEIVYWMKVPDYPAYMDTQQRINLALVEAFTERGISFAFPTRTLHVMPYTDVPVGPDPKRRAT